MKLHAVKLAHLNAITACGAGYVEVNGVRHETHVIVAPEMPPAVWSATDFDSLTPADLGAVLALKPEVVLLGTGRRQRFPRPAIMEGLLTAGIGVEVMDTAAACRTYSILVAEGRRVVAALLVER